MTDYLEVLDSTPDEDKLKLVRAWMESSPLDFFSQLRARRPILVLSECTLVSRFVDISDALSMPNIFSARLYKPKMEVTDTNVGYLMAHDDNSLHFREKSLMQGFLNRDDLPRIRKIVKEAALEILHDNRFEIEIVNNYCRVVPAIMVQKYMGLDRINIRKLLNWSYWAQYNTFHNQPFDLNSDEDFYRIDGEHKKCFRELTAYIKKLLLIKLIKVKVADRALFPFYFISNLIKGALGKEIRRFDDDIVSRMLRSQFSKSVDFPLERIGANAAGLLIGSVETTSQAVAQILEFLVNKPDLLAKAKISAQAENPSEIDNIVWEALRFVPISPYLFRQTSENVVIAKGTDWETEIRAGTNVLLLTQSAMFDDYAYSNADIFSPERSWYHHFNYGFGIHDCLGKYIGMVMIPEMVRQVLLLNNLSELYPLDRKGTPFPEQYVLKWSN